MRPFIFYSPEFSIPSFAFSIMLASLVATLVVYKMASRRGLSQIAALDLGIVGTIGGVLGARIFHVIVEEPMYYLDHPTHIYQIWRGGFVSYGVFIGLGVSWILYCKIRKLDTLRYLDHLCLFGGPVVIFFVRVGCILAGCCFGKPSPFDNFEYILFIAFNNPAGDAGHLFHGQHLWPTQIWAMTYAILIFWICYWVEGRNKFKGQVFLTFLMVYAFFRTILEFFRGDTSRGVYLDGAISTAQITSFFVLVICITIYLILRKRYPLEHPYPRISPKKKEPPTETQEPQAPSAS